MKQKNVMSAGRQGFAQIPLMIGLLLMAVAVPAVTSLVQQNQENRGKATGGCSKDSDCGTKAQCAYCYKDAKYPAGRCVTGCTAGQPTFGNPTSKPVATLKPEPTQGCYCDSKGIWVGTCGSTRLGTRCSGPTSVIVPTSIVVPTNGSIPTTVPIPGKQNDGTPCLIDANCSSNVCTGFVPNRRCVAKTIVNGTCVYDNECASNHCNGTIGDRHCVSSDANRPNGETCVWDGECSSGVCGGTAGNRKCTLAAARPVGSACVYDWECSNGSCSGVGANRKCVAKAPVNGVCTLDSDCASSYCNGAVGDRHCTSGASGRADGETCVWDGECSSGVCGGVVGNRKCTSATARPDNSACLYNTDCRSGVCNGVGANRKCVAKAPINGACVYDDECVSGLCNGVLGDRHCVSRLVDRPNGETCNWDYECESRACSGIIGNRKCVGLGTYVTPAVTSSACAKNGQSCYVGNNCCSGFYCASSRTCAPYVTSIIRPTSVPTGIDVIPTNKTPGGNTSTPANRTPSNKTPTAKNPTARPITETPGVCLKCPSDFKCYRNGAEYRWFVSGYVPEGFTPVSATGNLTAVPVASCKEQCPGTDGVLRNCHPPESDGSSQDSLCNLAGRREVCGTKTYCCPTKNGKWTADLSKCPGTTATPPVAVNCGGVPKPTFKGRNNGDANCDGRINALDLSLWQSEFMMSTPPGTLVKNNWFADFTGPQGVCDGLVNAIDLATWQSKFYEFMGKN